MSGIQPVDYLRLVKPEEENDGDANIESQDREPWWWRALVISTLRFGRWWFSPLWPAYCLLKPLRSWSIHRALGALRNELKTRNRTEPISIEEFLNIEANRCNDPRFRTAYERALRAGRIGKNGLYVILNEEIDSLGQGAFVRHLAWVVTRQISHPLPNKRHKKTTISSHLRKIP